MSAVAVLTLVHTAISLVGICSGLGVLAVMLEGRDNPATQTEPLFGVTQLAVMAVFVVLGSRRRGGLARPLPLSVPPCRRHIPGDPGRDWR